MIRLIAALDRKHGIAKHGIQPWNIPKDEEYFTNKTKTNGAQVLVGRKTFETFKKPLDGRVNFVYTRKAEPIAGAKVIHDLNDFMNNLQGNDLWVIGGSMLYDQVMNMGKADELYITEIDADFGCDQFFPAYENYVLQTSSDVLEQNGFTYRFTVYVRS